MGWWRTRRDAPTPPTPPTPRKPRKPKLPEVIPVTQAVALIQVLAAIEGAGISEHAANDDGPRIAVFWPAGGSFWWDRKNAYASMKKRWPGLSEEQMERAYKHLSARIKQYRREVNTPEPREKKSWVHDY